jgi:hypothetical protein
MPPGTELSDQRSVAASAASSPVDDDDESDDIVDLFVHLPAAEGVLGN